MDLPLLETVNQPIYVLEAVQDFLETTSPCDHYLAGDKDQEGHLGVLLPINQSREQFWHELDLRGVGVPADVVSLHLLEVDRKLHIC